ncbi:alpha/beta fold hydrolase [Streptomyces sp. NPDC058308]|uniref:alpha/beta fold hydrolase n=1 Tax=Streptomyces sp. NPDC058308 TaxID=3346440 RepID=UPI0036F0F526
MRQGIARHTVEGVPDARVSTYPFTTADGLTLHLTRFHRGDCDDVVLLLHGLTGSSDMFIMPEHRNLATHLLDDGFTDVWTLDFRMSNRFPYNTEPGDHTLDDVALHDHPAALAELRRHIGQRRVHVFAHCLGSTTFAMSLAAGTVTGVSSLVSQSVALAVRVPSWSRWKLAFAPTLLEHVLGLSAVDPRMADAAPFTRAWALARLVSLGHPECDNHACNLVSFMWGAGWPALYSHGNLAPETHERIADLLGPTGVHYYRHIRKMARAGRAVRSDPADPRHAALPVDYLAEAAAVRTPVLFLTGADNHVFGDANVVCHREFARHAPDRYELAVLPGYGYIDPVIGKDAHRDVFPLVCDFIRRRAGEPEQLDPSEPTT